jgi:NAD(P)-dependent dehydrogenase (short-subunit alcohol dehydrogenase family)
MTFIGEDLKEKCVVVTGATGGIGSAVAHAFAELGARVLAVDLKEDALKALISGLPGKGHDIYPLDLSALDKQRALFDHAQTMGGLQALAHCAAVLRRRSTVDEVTEEDWDFQLDTNLKATFFLNRSARDVMKANGTKGAIVNFSSQGWWTGGFGGSVVYAASKGGIVSMTRGLARSFAPEGIRVNAIAPGGVDTHMLTDGQSPEAMKAFMEMIPMGRLAEPKEISQAVVFLASAGSSYMTGALINISGGQLMY